MYLLIAVGLGSMMWPRILNHGRWDLMQGVAFSMLAALSAMAAPLLLFELLWKAVWLLAVALPLWSANQLDAEHMGTVIDCLMGVVLCPIVIPWPYVVANYVKKPGDRWRRSSLQAGE